MSDIVERLLTTRIVKTCDGGEHVLINPDGPEAADEIERLRAENERLRKGLVGMVTFYGMDLDPHHETQRVVHKVAEEALQETDSDT